MDFELPVKGSDVTMNCYNVWKSIRKLRFPTNPVTFAAIIRFLQSDGETFFAKYLYTYFVDTTYWLDVFCTYFEINIL